MLGVASRNGKHLWQQLACLPDETPVKEHAVFGFLSTDVVLACTPLLAASPRKKWETRGGLNQSRATDRDEHGTAIKSFQYSVQLIRNFAEPADMGADTCSTLALWNTSFRVVNLVIMERWS